MLSAKNPEQNENKLAKDLAGMFKHFPRHIENEGCLMNNMELEGRAF
jgi:hypothetical protein